MFRRVSPQFLTLAMLVGCTPTTIPLDGASRSDAPWVTPQDAFNDDATSDGNLPDVDDQDTSITPDAVPIPAGPTLISLAAGASVTCAVLEDHTARCWGDNREGQLGDGSTVSSVRPVSVVGLTDATSIAVGSSSACAIRMGGRVVCWGSGSNGRLGNGGTTNALTPVAVSGISTASEIVVGYTTACARLADGTVSCWGRGGDLGSTVIADTSVPSRVPGLSGVTRLVTASHGGTSPTTHTCGIRSDGSAFCWGINTEGQSGIGNQSLTPTPSTIPGLAGVTAIATGLNHACATTPSGTSCWGSARLLGDGTVDRRFSPGPVTSTLSFVDLSAGFTHTCARTSQGEVWCWGLNSSGQIGDGAVLTVSDNRLVPTRSLVTNARFIAAGMSHTCAYGTDQITWCWGGNQFGELGSGPAGSLVRSNVPSPVVW